MQTQDWRGKLVKKWFEKEDVQATPDHIIAEMRGSGLEFEDDEWKKTLLDFNYKCAYCRIRYFGTFDHFIPRNRGGRASIDNLVPACLKCNRLKSDCLPSELTFVSRDVINDIERYLRSRRKTTTPLDIYLVTFDKDMRKTYKEEFFRNIDEINARLEAIKNASLSRDEAIQVIHFGIEYIVRKVIVGVPQSEANTLSHCTFECENKVFQIYRFGASKEYAEDYLAILRMYCVMKSIFIDWNELR